MTDEPNGSPDPDTGPPSQSPLNIDKLTGPLIVVERVHRPNIPEGKGRTCPQCNEVAWIDSRFCWNCRYDFDRAALPKCHPLKLLAIAVSINLLVLGIALGMLLAHART